MPKRLREVAIQTTARMIVAVAADVRTHTIRGPGNSSRFRIIHLRWRRDIAGDLASDDAVDEHGDEVRHDEYWLTAGPPASLVPMGIKCHDVHNAWADRSARRRRRAAIDNRLGRRIPLGARIKI